MSKTSLLTACLAIVVTAGTIDQTSVRGAEPGEKRFAELRARFADDPRVKDAKAAITAADKAIEKKISSDPAIAEARRAEQAARENVAKAEQAAAAADPRVQAQRRGLEAARARASELELQRRVEETKAEHLRQQARGRADLRELRSKANTHAHSPEAAKADPRLAEALRKLRAADAALEKKKKELLKDLPEARASEQARKDFNEAVKASTALKDAEAARREIEEKVAADGSVAAQAAKLKAAGDAQAAHLKTIEEIEMRIRDASEDAVAKDARVKDAAKAAEEARARVGRTIDERLAAERKARQAARTAWQAKLEAVMAESPEAKALMNEMQSLEAKLRQVRTQIGELRRP